MQGRPGPACIYNLLNEMFDSTDRVFEFKGCGYSMLMFHCSFSDGDQRRSGALEHNVLLVVNTMAERALSRVTERSGVSSFHSVAAVSHPVIEDNGAASSMPIGFTSLGGQKVDSRSKFNCCVRPSRTIRHGIPVARVQILLELEFMLILPGKI